MRSLIQQLREHRPSGICTIVLIGAGDGADLPDLRTLNSRRMLLVEAHPEQLKALSRRVEPALGEEIMPVAAAATLQSSRRMFLCNNPRYSSLSRANGLEQHFPNLRITGETEVRTVPLNEILAGVSDTDDVGKLLILDAPGQSLELVRSIPVEMLETFDWIIVAIADAALFDGDGATDCLAVLDAAGFDPVAEDSGTFAPERKVLLQRNDPKVHRVRLAVEQERYSGQIAQLEIRHKAEVDKITAEFLRQADDHRVQLAKLTAERDQQAKVASERQAALDKVAVNIKKQAEEYKTELSKLAAECDELARVAEERKAETEKMARQTKDRTARIAQLEGENGELRQRQNLLDQEMIKAEAQIDLIKDVLLRDSGL